MDTSWGFQPSSGRLEGWTPQHKLGFPFQPYAWKYSCMEIPYRIIKDELLNSCTGLIHFNYCSKFLSHACMRAAKICMIARAAPRKFVPFSRKGRSAFPIFRSPLTMDYKLEKRTCAVFQSVPFSAVDFANFLKSTLFLYFWKPCSCAHHYSTAVAVLGGTYLQLYRYY